MSVNLCVCLSANSSKTANPIELKFCGMIPFVVQMVLGKTISGLDQPFAKNSKKESIYSGHIWNQLPEWFSPKWMLHVQLN